MADAFPDNQGSTVPHFIPIPGHSDDARGVRTRGELASALIGLMHEKGFDDISVLAICRRANVGRSTFYAHFEDKDELFIRHTLTFARELGGRLEWNDAVGSYQFPACWLFEHIRQMKPLFDSLARARKTEFILKVWQNNIAEVFEQRVQAARVRMQTNAVVPQVILAQQLSGTLITLMTWWMDHHYPLPECEMDAQFHQLIAGLR
ncbi:MAG: TetR/AcrR family transcriptional regulator [Dokdonella sp.]|uniref:TetR/AcrR family transcriptional regulator n=1 Tax=Dokdonella sp. TaxID=2291710 RepID=UPI00326678D8